MRMRSPILSSQRYEPSPRRARATETESVISFATEHSSTVTVVGDRLVAEAIARRGVAARDKGIVHSVYSGVPRTCLYQGGPARCSARKSVNLSAQVRDENELERAMSPLQPRPWLA